jgi:hypothetical protein
VTTTQKAHLTKAHQAYLRGDASMKPAAEKQARRARLPRELEAAALRGQVGDELDMRPGTFHAGVLHEEAGGRARRRRSSADRRALPRLRHQARCGGRRTAQRPTHGADLLPRPRESAAAHRRLGFLGVMFAETTQKQYSHSKPFRIGTGPF